MLLAQLQGLLSLALLCSHEACVVSGLLNLSLFSTSSFLLSPGHRSPWLSDAGAARAVLCPEQSVAWQEGELLAGLRDPVCKCSGAAGCSSLQQAGCPTSALLAHMENGAPQLPPSTPSSPQELSNASVLCLPGPALCLHCFTGKLLLSVFCSAMGREEKRKGRGRRNKALGAVCVLSMTLSSSPPSCRPAHFSQTCKLTLEAPWLSQPSALRAG